MEGGSNKAVNIGKKLRHSSRCLRAVGQRSWQILESGVYWIFNPFVDFLNRWTVVFTGDLMKYSTWLPPTGTISHYKNSLLQKAKEKVKILEEGSIPADGRHH